MPNRRSAVLALSLAALVISGCSGTGSHDSHASATSPSSQSSSSVDPARQGDIMFAQMMIPHHEQAVQMADLALDAKHQASAAMKELATQIKAAQRPEIKQMQGWLTAWGAPAAADSHAGHSMAGMMTEEQMSALGKATGSDFDRQWLTMMIAHHQGAVTMSEAVLKTTKDDDVKKLAEAIISAQKSEIDRMKKMLG